MSATQKLPPKEDVARALLLRGSVFVHLDPRVAGTVVPEWFAAQPQLVLQIGLDLPVPIPDLRVDDTGMFGTLSFNRAPFTCTVPWSAVFAVVGDDGRGMLWPESVPPEITAEINRESGKEPPPPPSEEEAKVVKLEAFREPSRVPAKKKRRAAKADARTGWDDAPESADDLPLADHSLDAETSERRASRTRNLPPYLRVVK